MACRVHLRSGMSKRTASHADLTLSPKARRTIAATVRASRASLSSKRDAQDALWAALGRDITIDEAAYAQRVWDAC